ncbi:BspA family leucine-rich repeat surface protein, partial [Acinetobacter baumannii]|uniref:BspA family leucine-rich repeat surface protein n=1 Tax=Acinetobacter baumannii TaxID=470 RepID=UPI00208F5AF2
MGVSSDDGSAFYGAIADYSLGLHAEDVVSINGICISSGSFNQRVNAWDVSEVTDASFTFAEAINFNREINWYAPNIQWVNAFLLNAKKFNKDITIRGAKPKSMSSFLEGASSFNSKINVDTSECDNFSGMFVAASKFNQPINFNFGKAVSLNNFLSGAKEFNQP